MKKLQKMCLETQIKDHTTHLKLPMLKTLKILNRCVVVHCQLKEALDLLEMFMTLRGYKYVRIDESGEKNDERTYHDGSMDPPPPLQSSLLEPRAEATHGGAPTPDHRSQINSSPFVILAPTRVSGHSINLKNIDTVIFYDSDWDPTVNNHVIQKIIVSQSKPIAIHRLITINSVEESVLQSSWQH